MDTMNGSSHSRGLIVTVVLGALAFGYATFTAAADMETRSTVVKYGDLNLSDSQGAATLYRRIVGASHQVCNYLDADRAFPQVRAYVDACVHKAIVEAVMKVGRPELIAAYNARNREPLPVTLAAAKTR
jgi:UrcA family protein